MTVDILDIVDEVQAEIPEVLEVTASRAVRQAAIEFYCRTGCWRVCVPLELVPGQSKYEVPLPPDSCIDTPFKVVYLRGSEERVLEPVQPHQIPELGDDGHPVMYAMTNETIQLHPAPNEGRLAVWLKLKPVRSANQLPADAEQWFYSIRAGAIAKLLMQVRQAWSDPNAAMPFLQQFENDILEASRAGRRSKVKQRRVVAYGGI